MNDHFVVLKKALDITKERGQTYDTTGSGVEENFTRAASIASLWLNRQITARDVALIMASVKMARIAIAPTHQDSYVDLVNYVSFGASFSVPSGNGAATGTPQKAPAAAPLHITPARITPAPDLGNG
jgi:hypothetical protein